ncbi:MAG: NAD(P)/FAD-dependent oxidoreductase [Vicinamibacterales bacterium]
MRPTADVIVVGGGPAGSTCAWRLRRAGLDVVVIDRAVFPRDKTCAGWITPAVVARLELDLEAYAAARTLQAFTGFRIGLIGRDTRLVDFGEVVSWGIRRCEFDRWLLDRSGARQRTGEPVKAMRREGDLWVVNEERAPVVVGAGGHFCPVARWLNPGARHEVVVAAQETEFVLDAGEAARHPVAPGTPALYFWPDLTGYGWCVRKGRYVNIGVGRLQPDSFPSAVREFQAFLESAGVMPAGAPRRWKGHAYLLDRTSRRRVHDAGVLIAGDAAGLARAPSGEGILPAVESGLMAAEAILDARPVFTRDALAPYAEAVARRFAWRGERAPGPGVPAWLARAAGRIVLASDWMTRHWLIERAFLHRDRRAA